MKRTLFFLLAGLILTLCAVQVNARTYVVTTTPVVTAPPIYWQYYNNYYAPMAVRTYYAVPPAYRPVRVYRPGYVVPPPPPVPYGYPPASVPVYYY
ncbi:MAG: hypothetical protein Q4A17_14105 [Thermoguttaceae bacterium]|nr:hypothetical protein [Thermoguttaceae bacterium]MDO4859065.1 hypothetical protein [Thermoguttaceae bacterium]